MNNSDSVELRRAINYTNEVLVKLLLNHRADINTQNSVGETVLMDDSIIVK